jgi:hypothetical protein
VLFDSRSICFGQAPDDLGDAAALPRSGKTKGTFDRC